MQIEIDKVTAPDLPRYFPPGYFFDWRFWLMAVINTIAPIFCAFVAYLDASGGNTTGLAFECAVLAFGLFSTVHSVRTVLRHSREWRTVDRPAIEAVMAQTARDIEAHMRAFTEWQNGQGANSGNHD
ncbi:hypothetical protein P0D88_34835 [Paraburkholderia sp. RL18-103-BIB-C]|uniref:hypothetical protein n=1 Tax=Paraburkholderia sp. RL18-103-BIB-C TaxID=3031637 RepID=UPI0038B93972